MRTRNYLGVIAAFCLTFTSFSSYAIPVYWSDNTGGTFNDATNWTGGILPGVGNEAIFNLGSIYTVNFVATPSNNAKLLIRNDDVTFDLGGYSYTLTSTAFPQASVTVGELNGDIGQLTITNGTVYDSHTLLGDQAGSSGTLNVSTGGVLSGSQTMRVGYYGDGVLNVTNGGTVSNAGNSVIGFRTGSTGTATVSGAGSSWSSTDQYIGYESGSIGSLSIQNAGSVTSGFGYIGYGAGSSGAVSVDGTGSSWNLSSDLRVGLSGSGTLTVSNGASITNNTRAIIGSSSTATGTATIDGGSWTNTGYLDVGYQGNGSMTIGNGGTVSNTDGNIARYSGSIGTVNVDGTGGASSWANSNDLSIGGTYQDIVSYGSTFNSTGNGTLNITNGGTVTAGRYAFIGTTLNSTGAMTVDGAGSSFSALNNFYVGFYGTGTMDVTNGGTVSTAISLIGGVATATNSSNATISGAGSNWTTSNYLDVRYGSLNINNGGSVTTQNYGNINTLGKVNVDGIGSSWGITSHLNNSAQLNVSNGASVSTGSYLSNNNGQLNISTGGSLATGGYLINNASGQFNISNGATVSTGAELRNYGTLNILNGGTASSATYSAIDGSGVATVAGTGATLTSSGSVYVGANAYGMASGAAVLNINTGGTVNVGDTLIIYAADDTVNLNGGTLNLNALSIGTGNFNHIAGALNFTSDFALGAAGPLGSSYSLNSLQSLGVAGIATIDPAGVLTLDGGTFSAGTLVNNGTFAFNSGTFNLTNANMTIGAGGLFGSNAQFGAGQSVNVSNATTVNSGSVLSLNNGAFSSGAMTNNGDIVLNGASSRLGGSLINNSILKGTGRVDAQVTNNSGAQIRVASGESMRFTAAGNTNAGRIEAIGGEVAFDQNLVNQGGTGNIVARNATLRFNGGLDNQGTMGFSFGTSDVFGDINNTGAVVMSGNSNTTFYDDYTNNGVTQTSTGSNAVFFGAVTGAGSYTGGGTLFFEGDLAPGNSPALVTVGGDMNLGFGALTIMELAGLTQGTEYDAFDIAGDLSLGGALDIDFLDMFAPSNGDYFDLFMAETITGDFTSLLFPGLTGGLNWDLVLLEDFNGTTDVLRLSVSAVPVPAAVWLFGSGLLGLFGVARRKARA